MPVVEGGAEAWVQDFLATLAADSLPVLSLSPHHRRQRTVRLIFARSAGFAAMSLVIVAVEDVRRMHATSPDALSYLSQRLDDIGLLPIVTSRHRRVAIAVAVG